MKLKLQTGLNKAAARIGVLALTALLSATVSSFADGHKVLNTSIKGGVQPNAAVNSPDNILPKGFSFEVSNDETDESCTPNQVSFVCIAQGSDPLENPSDPITKFGFLKDGTRTEPDENTYLILDHNPGGPTSGYDYGRHFLFQGHENSGELAYVTRINLDVSDPNHRITLLTPVGVDGKTHFNSIDGSTWNPFTKTLLFTQEVDLIAGVPRGGVIEIPVDWQSMTPPAPRTLYGILGHGGYEGIHPDSAGNLYLAEDIGGTSVNIDPNNPASPKTARNPNSFIYRFLPSDRTDLSKGGKLEALQVSIGGQAVTFVPVDANHPSGDVFSTNQLKLHTLGKSWPVQWVTVHDTAVDGFAEFNANQKAKDKGATPFKRPENLQFLPGSDFKTFFFGPTGDTDATAGNVPALAARGSWGSIFRVDLDEDGDTGKIAIVVLGDQFHASFDNMTFADDNLLLVAEDRGDTLHDQLNILDSVWAFDVTKNNVLDTRFIALGRDSEASAEDNEPTGLHFSKGDSSVEGLVGANPVDPARSRLFFTEQHGKNIVWEILGQTRPAVVSRELGK